MLVKLIGAVLRSDSELIKDDISSFEGKSERANHFFVWREDYKPAAVS